MAAVWAIIEASAGIPKDVPTPRRMLLRPPTRWLVLVKAFGECSLQRDSSRQAAALTSGVVSVIRQKSSLAFLLL